MEKLNFIIKLCFTIWLVFITLVLIIGVVITTYSMLVYGHV